jgi:hypothetical protein
MSSPDDGKGRIVRRFNASIDTLYGLGLIALAPVVYAENPGHFYVALASGLVGLFGLAHAYRVFTGRPGCPVRYQPAFLSALGAVLFSRGVWLWAVPHQWAEGVVLLSIGALGMIAAWTLLRKWASRRVD